MIYDDIKVDGFSFLISSSVRKYNIHIYKEQKIRTIKDKTINDN